MPFNPRPDHPRRVVCGAIWQVAMKNADRMNRHLRRFLLYRDLDIDQMTFIYELDPYPVEIYRISENELPMSLRLSKDIYPLTDIHTDTTKIIYHAALRVVQAQIIVFIVRTFGRESGSENRELFVGENVD